MTRQLTDLTFEQWLAYVFDHPVTEPAWYWDLESDWWDAPASHTVKFLTMAFENAGSVFQPYTTAQLNQGLWFVADPSCSNHMFALLDESVEWPIRQRCIRSIHSLFEHCFTQRCTPHLSHLDEPGTGPLNSVCYMWWDILPVYGRPDDERRADVDREILAVLESTLQIDSVACRESALHGLGHWQMYYPQQVTMIIDAFLQRHTRIRKSLKQYALNARRGYVL